MKRPGLLTRVLAALAPEVRRARDSWDFLEAVLGVVPGLPTVSADTVLSASSVATRCVGIRSEMLSSVPLFLFRRTENGGRERAVDTPLHGVLHDRFNESMTAFEGREYLIRSLDLAGNGFARVERDATGEVSALWPLNPALVRVERLPSGRLRYQVSEDSGGTVTLLQDDVLHIRGPLARDGVHGLSPIGIAREQLGLMVSQTQTAVKLSTSGLSSSGFLTTPDVLKPEDRQTLQARLERYTGQRGAGSLLVLEAGMQFKPLSWSPEDAELLASRKLSDEAVARLFGIPPTSVGITEKATYSNVEQESTMLVRNALAPLARRVESAMAAQLLTEDERADGLFIEHELSGLLRGDTTARFQSYATGRQWGWLSPNDVRRFENMPPIENGDVYERPLNMAPLGDRLTGESD